MKKVGAVVYFKIPIFFLGTKNILQLAFFLLWNPYVVIVLWFVLLGLY